MHNFALLLIKLFLFCIFTIFTYIALIYIYDKTQILEQPVHQIKVNIYGDVHEQDKIIINNFIKTHYPNNYINTNLVDLSAKLSQFTWIKSVLIKRKRNFLIDIRIIKRNIIGYWKNKNYLLDDHGIRIINNQMIINNTQLPTIDCTENKILQRIHALQKFQQI